RAGDDGSDAVVFGSTRGHDVASGHLRRLRHRVSDWRVRVRRAPSRWRGADAAANAVDAVRLVGVQVLAALPRAPLRAHGGGPPDVVMTDPFHHSLGDDEFLTVSIGGSPGVEERLLLIG